MKVFVYFLIIILFSGLVSAAFNDDIIACWDFNEVSGTNAADYYNDLNGTVINALVNQSCLLDKCFYYDGNSDYVNLPADSKWNLAGEDFTFTMWVKPDTYTARRALFAGNTDQWFGFEINQPHNNENFDLWASSTGSSWDIINADGGGSGIGTSGTVPDDGVWKLVTYKREGDRFISYINGTADLNVSISGNIINRAAETKNIGRWGYSSDRFL